MSTETCEHGSTVAHIDSDFLSGQNVRCAGPQRSVEVELVVDPLAHQLSALSEWIDASNGHRDAEAVQWGRLAKIGEEFGEVIEAFVGATGQNPRKGVTHSMADVCKELLDVAVTALAAYEHLTENDGMAVTALRSHVAALFERAGLSEVSS